MGTLDIVDVGGSLVKLKHIKKVELMLQSDPQENAAAALAMVLSYYGNEVSPWDLADETLDTAADLLAAARSRGLYAEGYHMTMQELCQAPFPLIAHWKFHSFVVVTGVHHGRVHVHSPEKGHQVFSLAAFEAGFTGVALCFAGGKEQAQQPKSRGLRSIFPYFPAVGALLIVCQLFFSACCIAMAMLMRTFVEGLTSTAGGGVRPALAFGAAALLQLGAAALQIGILRRCENVLRGRAVQACSAALSEKSPLFFKRMQQAQLDAVCKGSGEIPATIAHSTFCVLQLLTVVLCLLVIAAQEPVSALVSLILIAAFAAALLAQRETLYSDAKRTAQDRFYTQMESAEDLGSGERSRLSGQSRRRFETWMNRASSQARHVGTDRQTCLWYLFAAAEVFAVFFVGLLRLLSGHASTAGVVSCLWLSGVIAGAMGALPALLQQQMTLRGLLESYKSVFRVGGTAKASPAVLPGRPGSLTLQNAALTSKSKTQLGFQGVTLDVHCGEVVAVSIDDDSDGEVLAQALSGIQTPMQGGLYLDNINAAELSEEALYASVTLLGHGVPRPSGTVRDNIAAGCGSITDYAVVQAASDALLHDSILLRDQGYDTPVSTLSAGEKILLEFACAFARGTPFLVGNGITQVLDPDTEAGLLQAIRRRGVGAVLLTKTPALLRQADVVCRIEAGRLTLRERSEFLDWEEVSEFAKQA